MKTRMITLALVAVGAACGMARASALYSQGFEVNTVDWDADATRVASGTNGVTSASGSFHAVSNTGGAFTRYNGYNYNAGNNVPTTFREYYTSIDIYLDVNGGWANNTRFDWDSAISNSAGGFRRDFIYNAGFYNSSDLTGPGAGTNRFIIGTGNNSQPGSANPKTGTHDPIAIATTGWYTFQDHYYDNAGTLAVQMDIFDSSHNLVNSWTRSDASDLIGLIGGNRYGWFDYNQFAALPFDNASLTVVPLPAAAWAGMSLLAGMGLVRKFRNRRAPQI